MSEELIKEIRENADRLLKSAEGEEKVIVQGTSFVDHKCNFCKQKIPAGNGLIRVTKIIKNPYTENPIYSSKYYCDQQCKDGKKIIKSINDNPIPEGFTIVS